MVVGAVMAFIATPTLIDALLPAVVRGPKPWTLDGQLMVGFMAFGVFVLFPMLWLAPATLPSYEVRIGFNGITRVSLAPKRGAITPVGPLAMMYVARAMSAAPAGTYHDRWQLSWEEIDKLVFVEDYIAGGRPWKVLVVFSISGEMKVLGVGNKASPEDLAAVCGCHHRELIISREQDLAFLSMDRKGE
jgi:hypothetical protein